MDIFIVKENLINVLCSGIVPHILDGFMSIYEDALRVNPRNPFEQNKRFLLNIKTWPDHIITTEGKRIVQEFQILRKVLKTINFINIKSLALIGKNNVTVDDDYVSKNTPSVYTFIHKVYTNSAKEFFHDEHLMNFGVSGTRAKQGSVIESVIKHILNESVPMNDLLYNINDDTLDSQEQLQQEQLQQEQLQDNPQLPQEEGQDEEEDKQDEEQDDDGQDHNDGQEQDDDQDTRQEEDNSIIIDNNHRITADTITQSVVDIMVPELKAYSNTTTTDYNKNNPFGPKGLFSSPPPPSLSLSASSSLSSKKQMRSLRKKDSSNRKEQKYLNKLK